MRRAIAITALITGLTLANPAGASAVSRSFWGVVNGPAGNASQDFTLMSQGHVGTVRFVIARNIVRSSGFSSYDPYVAELAKRGIPVLPTLVMGPGDYKPPISGSDRTSWIQFVHNAVAHYGPGGSFWQAHPGLPNVPITSWQAGNEPSLPKYWQTSSPVKDYAIFLNLTHDAIRNVNPNATIVMAGLPGIVVDPPYRGWKFLSKLYGVPGAKRNFNIAAFQPYAHHVPDLRFQMRKFRRVMRRHGDGRKRVWITEFGYGSAKFNHRLNYGLDGQARMLRRTFRLFREKRRQWKVRGVIWYNWRDPAGGNSDCSFCSSSGLLRSNRQTKPAYGAFKRIAGHG